MAGELILRRAVFVRHVVLEAIAASFTCTDTIWAAGVTMWLRHTRVDLERATFTEGPSAGSSTRLINDLKDQGSDDVSR